MEFCKRFQRPASTGVATWSHRSRREAPADQADRRAAPVGLSSTCRLRGPHGRHWRGAKKSNARTEAVSAAAPTTLSFSPDLRKKPALDPTTTPCCELGTGTPLCNLPVTSAALEREQPAAVPAENPAASCSRILSHLRNQSHRILKQCCILPMAPPTAALRSCAWRSPSTSPPIQVPGSLCHVEPCMRRASLEIPFFSPAALLASLVPPPARLPSRKQLHLQWGSATYSS